MHVLAMQSFSTGWETSARQCEWKFGRASGKQAWASWILCRLYKRLPGSGECQKILVSQPAVHYSYVNWLWPSDAICRHISGSALIHVMACCLTAPSHYLKQCWHINQVQWHSARGCFTSDLSHQSLKPAWKLKTTYLKLQQYLQGSNELTMRVTWNVRNHSAASVSWKSTE